jgi:hypothetical protein
MEVPDFVISEAGPVSAAFIHNGCTTYMEAAAYVKKLPYNRNTDKNNPLTVFNDGCGTCGTKHAVLKRLATENNFNDIELLTGIFKMSAANSPAVASILNHFGLPYIPEAHNYLKYKGVIFDYTLPGNKQLDFTNDLMAENPIQPEGIGADKVAHHKKFLANWLKTNSDISYNLDELWDIREACIMALSGQKLY